MKLKAVVVTGVLLTCAVAPLKIQAHDLAKHDKTYSTNMFLSDDVASLQYFIHQNEEQEKVAKLKQDAENAKKKAEQSRKEKLQKEKSSDKQESKKEEKDSSKEQSKEPVMVQVGKLRLSNHNDSREEMIRKLNRYWAGHGLSGQGEAAVNAGIKYNIDPYILASISMTESTGGDYNAGSHNAWGRKSARGGWCSWSSWSEALDNEAHYLSSMYLDRGITSLTSIAKIYCPPTYMNWAAEVRSHQNEVRNK